MRVETHMRAIQILRNITRRLGRVLCIDRTDCLCRSAKLFNLAVIHLSCFPRHDHFSRRSSNTKLFSQEMPRELGEWPDAGELVTTSAALSVPTRC